MYYRKLPVVIQAIMWDGTNYDELCEKLTNFKDFSEYRPDVNYLYISTLEGVMQASIGDFIVRGVNGEFYPCKNDIFLKTYEKVPEEEVKNV